MLLGRSFRPENSFLGLPGPLLVWFGGFPPNAILVKLIDNALGLEGSSPITGGDEFVEGGVDAKPK